MVLTTNPLLWSNRPALEATMPFPAPEMTPRDVSLLCLLYLERLNVRYGVCPAFLRRLTAEPLLADHC